MKKSILIEIENLLSWFLPSAKLAPTAETQIEHKKQVWSYQNMMKNFCFFLLHILDTNMSKTGLQMCEIFAIMYFMFGMYEKLRR